MSEDTEITAYCVKCKAVRPMQDAAPVYMANGRPATRGVCPVCGTGLFKIGETPAHAGLSKPEKVETPRRAKAAPAPAGDAAAAAIPSASAPLTQPVQAYCVKCKTMRPLKDGRAVFMANGGPAAQGVCPECGTRLFKIGATPDHADLPKPARTQAARPARQAATKMATGKAGASTPTSAAGKTGAAAKTGAAGKTGGWGRSGAAAGKTAAKTTGKVAAGKSTAKAGASAKAGGSTGRRGAGRLVIVESPAKARTVGRFLGHGYDVRASVGHVRDLLRSKLSVDIEHDFAPTYRVPNEKRSVVKEIKNLAANASEIYLATDPDREGEAIAWHLLEAAEIPPERTRRVVFHEITQSAIAEAFTHARDVDMRLVDAQQARRILDRLVGYQVSPLLWSRVRSRLSAGRVQSVALRLIVEREREIMAFVPVEYWSLDAELAEQTTRAQAPRPSFLARLVRIRGEEPDLKNREDAAQVVKELEGAAYTVANVRRGERRRRPNPPFTTSTLQQDASQRLGMTAARTMRVAQQLYEGIELGEAGSVGLITYMRTDSVNVAQEAQVEARALIVEKYGPEYAPVEPNVYKSRTKNAQEAHEAIRPTSSRRTPDDVRPFLSREQLRVYELVWQRFLASQMTAAVYETMSAEVAAGAPGAVERPYLFRATGSTLKFPGFLVVYAGPSAGSPDSDGDGRGQAARNGNGAGGDSASSDGGVTRGEGEGEDGGFSASPAHPIPLSLYQGEPLDLLRLLPEQHFTQPPPRYTEASLVKTLEENGIGRPSTYAAIISTILDRGYVERSEKKLVPTELGFTVNDLLVKHFDQIFNVNFTAGMEEHLDDIAKGQETLTPVLRDFYDFFAPQLRDAEQFMETVKVEPEKIGEACPQCGSDLVIKLGRFGKFIGCANYPTCNYTRPLVTKLGVTCPKDGGELVERRTRAGRIFYGCANYPACDFTSWKRPLPQPCPYCSGLLVVANKDWAECTVCHQRTRLDALGEPGVVKEATG
jgi:DNA topoisomerase I